MDFATELLLEQSFARVPHENYRKVFRAGQKHIEKDFVPILSLSSTISQSSKELDAKETSSTLDQLIAKVEGLKRKLSDLNETTGMSTLGVIRERIEHLSAVESRENRPDLDEWHKRRLERWIVDWLLRHGLSSTALTITSTAGIENLVDIDLFDYVQRIDKALQNRSCTEALSWCSDNKAALRKAKINLELELRLQEFIELARARKTTEAIAYSKKHLSLWQETHLEQLTQAAALLAVPPTTTYPPYKRLYDVSRWEKLVEAFRLAFFNLFSLPTEPLLHLALFGGLSALKLPSCVQDGCNDCPSCSLSALTTRVPRAHHLNSSVVCHLSGTVMDADNPPMAFPNGYIYSRRALEEMAMKNNGRVTCPRSKLTVDFAALKKVYVS